MSMTGQSAQPGAASSAQTGAEGETFYVTPPLSARATYSFALGEVGVNMPWNMVTGFLLFYYTNIVFLPVAAVGTILLATRFIDALIDPSMGALVDRTKSRFGKARPYLMAATLPFAFLFAMTFSVPDWSVHAKLAYAWITFGLLGVVFAMVYIPCHAMLPLMTNNRSDKLKLGSLRAIAVSLGSTIVYAATMPIVLAFGENKRLGFTVAAAAAGICMTLTIFGVVINCPERLAHVEVQKLHLGRDVSIMLRNKVWRMTASFTMVIFLRLGVVISATAFYAVDILHAPWAASLMLSSLSVSFIIGSLMARPMFARMSKRKGNLISLCIAIALCILMFLVQKNLYAFAIVYFLFNIPSGIQSATVFILVADAVDEQQSLSGVRNEGLLSSCVSLSTKIGLAVGSAITAYTLAYVHYDPKAVSDMARTTIMILFFGGSLFFACVQMLVIGRYRDAHRANVAS